MKRILLLVFAALTVLAVSCATQEVEAPESGVTLSVGEYPALRETKAIGVSDPGKTEWVNGDVLYIVFQTSYSPVAARYRATRTSGGWNNFEKYEGGAYSPAFPMTAPEASRALVYYAPSYEFSDGAILSLVSGKVAGTDEFFLWKSGQEYNLSGNVSLNVSFVRDYSRLRVVSESGFTVKMKSGGFVPAGYNTSALGTASLVARADTNANAFYFGSWPEGTSFEVNTFDTSGAFSFGSLYADRPSSVNGTSYALDCRDSGTYVKISEINDMATKSGKKFNVMVKNAVVSYVIGKYAHLEDGSGATLVYVNGHGLQAGESLTGTISGTVKLYDGCPEITALDYSKATVTEGAFIPCTEMELSGLLGDFDANLHRRILLRDITVDKGIKSGKKSRTGQISQNGSTIAIYGTYSDSPAVLEAGLEGDLVAFPVYHNGGMQLSVYESDQFTEGGGGDPEQTAFAKLSVMGFYSNTNTDSPSPVMAYVECEDQYSFGKSSGKSFYHQFNLERGTYGIVDLDATSYKIGSEFDVTANLNGASEVHSIKVVNKNGTMAWLEDKTNNVGYIIAVK